MPEGDTVLRTARRLDQAFAGAELLRTELRWPDLGDVDLAGRRVDSVTAYGKHILMRLAAGAGSARMPTAPAVPLTLHSHLRMDGQWYLHAAAATPWPPRNRHTIRAILDGPDWTAVGIALGMLDLLPTSEESALLGHLGPDILADSFPDGGLAASLERLGRSGDRPVGAALLDQTMVAGIGTFYMSEALFVQRVSPWTPVAAVDLTAILTTARRQLARGATSAVPTTTGDPRNKESSYVHARSGRPCRRCGTTIRVAQIGQAPKERPAFYCPTCQPGPTPTDSGRPMRPLGASAARPELLRGKRNRM